MEEAFGLGPGENIVPANANYPLSDAAKYQLAVRIQQAQKAREALGGAAVTGALSAGGGSAVQGDSAQAQPNFGPTDMESGELAQIEKDLTTAHGTLDKLNRRYRNDPNAADRATKPYYDTINRLEGRKDNIMNAIAGRKTAYDTQQNQAAQAEAERTRQAEQPFRQGYPDLYRALPVMGWGTAGAGSALSGLAMGASKMNPVAAKVAAALTGGVMGGLESGAASAAPTVYDAETLPFGSKYQTEASGLLGNPDYWMHRVGPAAGIGAVSGLLGGYYGATAGKAAKAGGKAISGLLSGAEDEAPAATATAKPKVQGQPVTLPDGSTVKRYDYPNGVTKWHNGKSWISAPDLSGKVSKLRGVQNND
jgi:hypothetical protein